MLALSNEFLRTTDTRGADGTRPSNTEGTSVTPGASNTYGVYTAVTAAPLAEDAYWIEIYVHSVSVAASNRMAMINVGSDPAGGTAYAAIAAGLLVGSPNTPQGQSVSVFRFPLFFKAGTTVAVKAASLNADATAIRVYMKFKHAPTRPELVRCGTFVQTFGVTEPTVGGVAVTPGGVSDGVYAEIGTATKPLFYLAFGYSIDDATMTTANVDVDIAVGDATNKRVVIPNSQITTSANEILTIRDNGQFCDVAVGDKIYARAQSSGAADANNSIAVYGVG